MKVVQLLEDLEIQMGGRAEEKLEKKNFYIMSDEFYSKLKTLADYALGVEIPFLDIYNPYQGQDLNNRKILSIRHGGFGDILFLLTGYSELKRKYPQSSLNLAISPMYFPTIENNPDIDQVFSLPIKLDDWNEFHYHLIFEGLIENNPEAEVLNAYDLFMQQMSLNIREVPPENKIPKLFFKDQEFIDIKKAYPQLISNKKKVGIQIASSSPIRNYPPHKFLPVIEYLISKDYEVYLFGSSNQSTPINYLGSQFKSNIYKIIGPLREALVMAKLMDYIIACDSMFIHAAGALRIPLIGLYGPFHSSLRMKYFMNAIGIDARTACSPCFQHGHSPCSKGDPSPCMNLITSEMIIDSLNELENKCEVVK